MTESVYVNRDLTAIVPEGDPKAAYKIHLDEAKRRGLLDEQPKANKIVEPDVPAKRTYTRRATKTDDE